MDARNLQRYEQLLLAKRREVLGARPRTGGSVPAAGVEPGDVIGKAAADCEARVQARLRETESHLLRAIAEALGRIDRGTFGVCEGCRRPISEVRLEAVPWTHLCRGCKEQWHLAA
jgi:DnaK suppressor protein